VEAGSVEAVLAAPQHPYTKALLDCVPRMGGKKGRLQAIDHAALEAAMSGGAT
jgi:oligopeptide/dipeptide ABC transporter ATP-binding protein